MNQTATVTSATHVSSRHGMPVEPLPKINVPPVREVKPLHEERMPKPADMTVSFPRPKAFFASASGIRWDARFGLSLLALLVLVNGSLVLLFAEPASAPRAAVAAQTLARARTQDAPALNALAPAAEKPVHAARRTTTYISSNERKMLLEQLNRTRAPGIVSVSPVQKNAPLP